jgi:hypothetical protein
MVDIKFNKPTVGDVIAFLLTLPKDMRVAVFDADMQQPSDMFEVDHTSEDSRIDNRVILYPSRARW